MINASHGIEPLDPELWFAAFARLSNRLADSPERDVESLLRHTFHLLQLAPRPLRKLVRSAVDEETFETLLLAGALDSAAIALVGAPAGIELGRRTTAGADLAEARIVLPWQETLPPVARAESIALAVVGAWTGTLLAIRQQSLEDRSQHPTLHAQPSESHPKSSGH